MIERANAMETQNVGSDYSVSGIDPRLPFHMILLKEHTKYELIILTYRIAVIVTGIVLVILSYLLFANLVIENGSTQSYYWSLNKIAPGTVFAVVGILFCISGITKLMPLPKFEELEQTGNSPDINNFNVPTLLPISGPDFTGKLWEKNVKPMLTKVANNESLSRSDRELLRNWLQTL